jgi:DNA-binding NtrC family response regulator
VCPAVSHVIACDSRAYSAVPCAASLPPVCPGTQHVDPSRQVRKSIPREVFESEFFGHARGAFTGALRDRPGRFHLADEGTIFLDKIGELPLDMQPKLLRVLQEEQYERVGEDVTRKLDVRVVATNQDLQAEARACRLRQDLLQDGR